MKNNIQIEKKEWVSFDEMDCFINDQLDRIEKFVIPDMERDCKVTVQLFETKKKIAPKNKEKKHV